MNNQARFLLSACHVSKRFDGRSGALLALDGINLTVANNEFVCIVGPSGCGKSTLLRILAGLVKPTAGELLYAGGARPTNALVFQEHGLYPWMTVLDNVAFGLEAQGMARARRREQAHRILDQMGLGRFALSYPHELSVGMRQRAAIARAFLVDPQLLLMDEPFSALDAQSKLVLQEELLQIWQAHGKTVVYVTHDIEEAVLLADRIVVMSGRPSRIEEIITIPLSRPRDLRDRSHPEVQEIAWQVWSKIEQDVRRSLALPS
jgi:NitT/TauT family transport system ATP-binding protein